jgi:hypothetical protein
MAEVAFELVEGCGAIDLGFSPTEEVEVGAVEHQESGHRRAMLGSVPASLL